MDLNQIFKGFLEVDPTPIVVCDLNHTIIYMNPKADENYLKHGGKAALVGKSIFACHNPESQEKIKKVIEYFKKDVNNNFVHTFYNPKYNKDVYMVALRDENKNLIGYYERHEFRTKDETPLYNM